MSQNLTKAKATTAITGGRYTGECSSLEANHKQTDTNMMNALEGKLEAMMITQPDRKTKHGKKQAQRIWYLQNKVQKAKFSAKYHKEHDYAINRVKAIKRANDSKSVKRSTLEKYNIKWDQNTQKYHSIGKMCH